jgi:hypothetical protein
MHVAREELAVTDGGALACRRLLRSLAAHMGQGGESRSSTCPPTVKRQETPIRGESISPTTAAETSDWREDRCGPTVQCADARSKRIALTIDEAP